MKIKKIYCGKKVGFLGIAITLMLTTPLSHPDDMLILHAAQGPQGFLPGISAAVLTAAALESMQHMVQNKTTQPLHDVKICGLDEHNNIICKHIPLLAVNETSPAFTMKSVRNVILNNNLQRPVRVKEIDYQQGTYTRNPSWTTEHASILQFVHDDEGIMVQAIPLQTPPSSYMQGTSGRFADNYHLVQNKTNEVIKKLSVMGVDDHYQPLTIVVSDLAPGAMSRPLLLKRIEAMIIDATTMYPYMIFEIDIKTGQKQAFSPATSEKASLFEITKPPYGSGFLVNGLPLNPAD